MGNSLLDQLAVGDLRTTGVSDEVVMHVLSHPEEVAKLFAGLQDERAGVRMRSADALEKIGTKKPEWLVPFTDGLINVAKSATQQEVQWHVAQMLTYVPLDPAQAKEVAEVLFSYYRENRSNIVKVFSLTALAHLARQSKSLEPQVNQLLEDALKNGSPSIKSRARKLLAH